MPHLDVIDLKNDRQLAISMHIYAGDWLEAAEELNKVDAIAGMPSTRFLPQVCFCALQCFENTLKSFLFAQGVSIKKLKDKYGHKVLLLLKSARKLDLDDVFVVDDELEAMINLVEPKYSGKKLQYFTESGTALYPVPEELLAGIRALHDAIGWAYRSRVKTQAEAEKNLLPGSS